MFEIVAETKTLHVTLGGDDLLIDQDNNDIDNLSQLVLSHMQQGEIETLDVFVARRVSVDRLMLKLVEILPTLPILKFKLVINISDGQNLLPLLPIIRTAKWQALCIDALPDLSQSEHLYDAVRENENITTFHLGHAFSYPEDSLRFAQLLAVTPNLNLQELGLSQAKLSARAATLLLDPMTFPSLKVLDLSWNPFTNLSDDFNLFCDKIPQSQLQSLSLTAPAKQANAQKLCAALLKLDHPFTLTFYIGNSGITDEALDEYLDVLYQNPFLIIMISDLLETTENRAKVAEIELLSYENATIVTEDSQKIKDSALMQRYHSLLLANDTKEQLGTMGITKAVSNKVPSLQALAAKGFMKNIETRSADLNRLPLNLLLSLPARSMTQHLSIVKTKYGTLETQLDRLNLQASPPQEQDVRSKLIKNLRSSR